MRKLFNTTSLAGTLLVFAFMWGFSKIGVQLDFLNAVEATLKDFSLADVYYRLRDSNDVKFDDRVVLVNIGDRPRSETARQILTLLQYEPAVIGIDALFYGPNIHPDDSIRHLGLSGDDLLEIAFSKAPRLVLVGEAEGYDEKTNRWDSLHRPYDRFARHVAVSYANTVTDEDGGELFNTWRRIKPQFHLKDSTRIDCFAGKVVSFYDSSVYAEFIGRGNDIEDIYFKGNIPNALDTANAAKYAVLDVDDVLQENFTPDAIRGKIVLMGYMGTEYTSTHWDTDKFYTPLNPKPVGRTWPDMYGVVIHANIISMMLDRNYIDNMPDWLAYAIAFVLCYLNVTMFVYILEKPRLAPWYGALSKLIQLAQAILLGFLTVQIFTSFYFKPEFTLAIVAILLSGDLAEIYMDFVENVLKRRPVKH
jgi:CHASE2 domain-containing sensor protein